MNPLKGRRGYWLRQLTPDTGEGTLAGVIATMKDYGAGDVLCLKVADGLSWQGAFDSTLPINSLADVLAARDLCRAAGVELLPVVVPRGRDAALEAANHAEIAAAVGCLMTDIEPYQGFYYPDQSTIPQYTRALRAAAPAAYLINQPDPRAWGMSGAQVAETATDFDAICAQHYVGWASIGWTNVTAEVASFARIAALGRDMLVTLYGVERTDLAAAFWAQIKDRAQGMCVFALGPMNGDQLRTFGALPLPVFTDPCADKEIEIARLADALKLTQGERDDLQAMVARVREAVGGTA